MPKRKSRMGDVKTSLHQLKGRKSKIFMLCMIRDGERLQSWKKILTIFPRINLGRQAKMEMLDWVV